MSIWSRIQGAAPRFLKRRAKSARKAIRYQWRRLAIQRPVRRGAPIKIIVGAAETSRAGWYATNEQWLDVTKPEDWHRIFQCKKILTHVVAEHVFEHLTPDETRVALRQIFEHLVPGGRLRIAVPDGYHPDPSYRAHTCINGIGDDASDHKQVLNVDVLTDLLEEAGFESRLLEGYRSDGHLTSEPYSTEDGYIWRSRANRGAETKAPWAFVDSDTSLIVDGVMPTGLNPSSIGHFKQ